jgi:hypothetical protein
MRYQGRGRGLIKSSISTPQGLKGSEIRHPCLLFSTSYQSPWICHGRGCVPESGVVASKLRTLLRWWVVMDCTHFCAHPISICCAFSSNDSLASVVFRARESSHQLTSLTAQNLRESHSCFIVHSAFRALRAGTGTSMRGTDSECFSDSGRSWCCDSRIRSAWQHSLSRRTL